MLRPGGWHCSPSDANWDMAQEADSDFNPAKVTSSAEDKSLAECQNRGARIATFRSRQIRLIRYVGVSGRSRKTEAGNRLWCGLPEYVRGEAELHGPFIESVPCSQRECRETAETKTLSTTSRNLLPIGNACR